MSVSASDRIQVARIFATRRCEELDHVRKPAPCQRCLAWTQRRVDELERAGVIRTVEDRANAAALLAAHELLVGQRRQTRAAIAAGVGAVLAVWVVRR